jgi:hypothetical protein
MNHNHITMKQQATIIKSDEGLGIEALRQSIPSIFTETAAPGVSEKYRQVPTIRVLEPMLERGWVPVWASQQVTNHGGNHQKHMIRLRHPTLFGTPSEKSRPGHILRENVMEVVLVNSHDRSAAYKLYAGLFRWICSNGLIIRDRDLGCVNVKHIDTLMDRANILAASEKIVEGATLLASRVTDMQAREMLIGEKLEFASKALELRYGAYAPTVSTDAILAPRRKEDEGDNLWLVLNRVQENIMRGTTTGRHRSKEITSLTETLTINEKLWQMAARLLDATN